MTPTPPWLLLDCNYLAYRAFFTTGALSYKDTPTGVMYGVLRQIPPLMDLFMTDRIVLCFDHGKSKRAKIYPNYKSNRRQTLNEEQEQSLQEMREQVKLLRLEYLPAIGFKNIFWQDGYEADDCLAIISQNLSPVDSAIIISADQDLFQLLSSKVSMWNPYKKRRYTAKWFYDEYHLRPSQWATVKAIAGCSSDNIKGIAGIGEKTAANFLAKTMVTEGKKFKDINTQWRLVEENLKLTKLPFPGIKNFELVQDQVTPASWKTVTDSLGMKSLVDMDKGFNLV